MVSDTKSGGGLRVFAAGDAERGVLGIAESEADAGADELATRRAVAWQALIPHGCDRNPCGPRRSLA
jgi:hypothetical protein